MPWIIEYEVQDSFYYLYVSFLISYKFLTVFILLNQTYNDFVIATVPKVYLDDYEESFIIDSVDVQFSEKW